MQPRYLDAHLYPQLRIEVGERLVEQENLRFTHDGAADGDTLPLAAGKLLRPALHQLVDLQDFGGAVDPLLRIGLGIAIHSKAEGQVFGNRHMRIKRIGLEHHGDAAIRRIGIIDRPAADADITIRYVFQPGNHAQQRGFAASGGANEDDEFAVGNIQIGTVDDFERAVTLDHVLERKFRHAASPYLTAPAEMPAMK
ncbi:hypothetical protein D3C86_1396650 [compost metagenome]